MSMSRRQPGFWVVVSSMLVVGAALGFVTGRRSAVADASRPASSSHPESPASPISLIDVGGIYMGETGFDLKDMPPSELPYPYTTPVPPETPTVLDGAYLRIIPLEQLGSAKVALPIRCLRCIPFRLDAGVSTLTLYHGRYFLDHHLSGFRSLGFYEVGGQHITLFDDPNCGTTRGVYRWTRTGSQLQLHVIDDPCPFDELRAADLTTSAWTAFDHCIVRFEGLWPGELGCRNRAFDP